MKHSFHVKKLIEDKQEDGSDKVSKVAQYKIKNNAHLKFHKDIYNLKFMLGNTFLGFDLKAEPKDFNNDDKTLELKVENKFNPQKQLFTVEP